MSISGGDYAQATFTHTDGTNTYLDAATNSQALYLANNAGIAIYLVVPARFQNIITAFKGISTAGLGVPAIYGVTLQKSETGAADNNVLTYTPPAVAGSYRASMSFDVSASTAGICGWTISYKDSNGAVQTPTNIIMFASGILAGGLTLTVAANGHYFGYMDFDIDNSATNIVFKFTYTSGTLAGNLTVRLEQLA